MSLDKNFNILIVDDSTSQRFILKSSLKKVLPNSSIHEAINGRFALEILNEKFLDMDLVISDWNMPDFDGMELLVSMRDQNIDVPFIFMTSNLTEKFQKKAIEVGARSFLQKPYSLEMLKKSLENALSK